MDADIKTLLDKLDDVERSIDMVRDEAEKGLISGSALVSMECDAEELAAVTKKIRLNRMQEISHASH